MILYPSLVIRTHLQLHPQTNIKKYYGTIYSSHFQAAQIISTDPAHGIDGIYRGTFGIFTATLMLGPCNITDS